MRAASPALSAIGFFTEHRFALLERCERDLHVSGRRPDYADQIDVVELNQLC